MLDKRKTKTAMRSCTINFFKRDAHCKSILYVLLVLLAIHLYVYSLHKTSVANARETTDPSSCQSSSSVLVSTTRGKTYWVPSEKYKISMVLEARGWRMVQRVSDARIVHSSTLKPVNNTSSSRIISSVGHLKRLTVKDNLAKYMKNYTGDIIPETFRLHDSVGCNEFFYGQSSSTGGGGDWVFKHVDEAGGEGILFIGPPGSPSYEELKSVYGDCGHHVKKERDHDKYPSRAIVQKYIENPLLLDGHKMEIRTYFAILHISSQNDDPPLLLYHDGLVRLAPGLYAPGTYEENRGAHISNVLQNKKENGQDEYLKMAQALKWDLGRFTSYLQDNGYVHDAERYMSGVLRPRLKEIIARGIVASNSYNEDLLLGDGPRFELFGMDTILDDDLNVWLTEFQQGPGLSIETPLKKKLILGMLDELLSIVVELDDNGWGEIRSLCEWQLVDYHNLL